MMNRCAYQQNALGAFGGEIRRGDSIYGSDGVVCPKPRRLGLLNPSFDDQIRPSRPNPNRHQGELCDSRAGAELLDMILTKGSYGAEMPGTPPFLWGSPPSRVSNPVIQDSKFGNDRPVAVPEASPSSSSARKQGGCARAKFGHTPAAVRIEGFNCRGNCSISAVA
ncbi:hypothetical protein LguiA_027917 [Lonicera macranthoides]